MPIKRIQFPDGSIKRVEVPEGATDQQILDFVQSSYKPKPKADFSQVSPNSGSSAVPGAGRRAPLQYASGAGLSLGHVDSMGAPSLEQVNDRNAAWRASVNRGGLPGANAADRAAFDAQERARMSGRRKVFDDLGVAGRFAYGAGRAVDKVGRGIGQMAAEASDAMFGGDMGSRLRAGETVRRREDGIITDGYAADDVGEFAGNVAMMAMPASKVSALPSLTGRIAGNVALGATAGGLAPVGTGESRGGNMLVGGAAGGLGMAAGAGLQRLGVAAATPKRIQTRALAQRARQLGIPVTPAQVSDSIPVKTLASSAKYLPFTGAGGAAQRQQAGFNRALARTFGADADMLTDDVVQTARKGLSSEFSDIYARNDVPIGPNALQKLADVNNEWSRRMTNDQARVLSNQLDDIIDNAASGTLTGEKYQAVRTMLMKAEGHDALGTSIRELRRALDDVAADAVGPADAQALKQLRGKWANLRTVEGLLKQVGGAGGDVKPSSIWPAIRKGSTKEMRELGRIGQVVLKDPIPDSGTGGRLFQYSLLGGLGGAPFTGGGSLGLSAGQLGLGATLGRAANSDLLGGLVARHAPGMTRRLVGKQLPILGLGATPVMAQPKKP